MWNEYVRIKDLIFALVQHYDAPRKVAPETLLEPFFERALYVPELRVPCIKVALLSRLPVEGDRTLDNPKFITLNAQMGEFVDRMAEIIEYHYNGNWGEFFKQSAHIKKAFGDILKTFPEIST